MTSSSLQAVTRRRFVIAAIAAALAQPGIQPSRAFGSTVACCDSAHPPSAVAPGMGLALPVTQARPADGIGGGARTVTFTIPLATFDDIRRLDERPEIADVLETAHRYSDSRIYLAAYVAPDDVPAPHVEACGVADELVIEVGSYLARHGVEADRISGKGMGIDSTIGRAVVVSFDITPAPSPWWPAPTNATAPVLLRTGLS
jgi:hypothetical protein